MSFQLRVRVPDVAAAVDFYVRAFGWQPEPPAGRPNGERSFMLDTIRLDVAPEESGPSEYRDPKQKGIVPRLEVCVSDVPAATSRFIGAGGSIATSVGEPPRYTQVLDPFGHMWSFSSWTGVNSDGDESSRGPRNRERQEAVNEDQPSKANPLQTDFNFNLNVAPADAERVARLDG